MSFFSNLFKLKRKEETRNTIILVPPELERLNCFQSTFSSFLEEYRYICKSDYRKILVEFAEVYKHYVVICDSGILPEYCYKYSINSDTILSAT